MNIEMFMLEDHDMVLRELNKNEDGPIPQISLFNKKLRIVDHIKIVIRYSEVYLMIKGLKGAAQW